MQNGVKHEQEPFIAAPGNYRVRIRYRRLGDGRPAVQTVDLEATTSWSAAMVALQGVKWDRLGDLLESVSVEAAPQQRRT